MSKSYDDGDRIECKKTTHTQEQGRIWEELNNDV